jgi:hypothetical protein
VHPGVRIMVNVIQRATTPPQSERPHLLPDYISA